MSGSSVVSIMYTIGEFAGIGRVSVRMLRHYDAIGLLPPAHVDDRTGYRRYSNEQIPRLLRIVELRRLDIGLDRVAAVLAADDEDSALIALLRSRRGEIEAAIVDDTASLARIDRRLRQLEGEPAMSTSPVSYRPIDPVTVYAVTGVAPGMGPEHVGPVVGPLIEDLDRALESAGRPIIPPAIFWYETVEDGEGMIVHVSQTAEARPRTGEGYEVVELPATSLSATILHRGDMSGIGDTWLALVEQLVADGYRMTGANREVYLNAPGHIPGPDWVTELQVPVEAV
ncbi:MerR family transcriptional regulator [Rathayibacter sp. YIM 133350]|uniref:MerR family transcriptional regulator n=1 Tax=Rathayibacter sp. YIM 133350 TaxID=3131992 RepID=UPI00307CDB1F